MALISKKFTDQEKVAIVALIYGYLTSWPEAYRIAAGMTEEEAKKDSNLSVYCSRWKQSEKVKNFVSKLNSQKAINEHEFIQKYERERRETIAAQNEQEGNKRAFVDYTSTEAQMKKLNELVNNAKDPDAALDALKVIIASQKEDKQAAREQQVQRFYTPQGCNDCAIRQAFEKLAGKNDI